VAFGVSILAAGMVVSALAPVTGVNAVNANAAVATSAALRPAEKLIPLRVIMSLSFHVHSVATCCEITAGSPSGSGPPRLYADGTVT
jgi:hypothetical protein